MARTAKATRDPDVVTPTKAIPFSVGELTDAKLQALRAIRDQSIAIANTLTAAVFVDDFLSVSDFSPKHLQRQTLALQKAQPKGQLNRVYIEKAREMVEAAVWEQHVRAKRALCAAVHNIGQPAHWKPSQRRRFEKRGEPVPIYRYVPVDLQAQVVPADFETITSTFGAVPKTGRLAWLTALLLHDDPKGLSPRQCALVHHAYAVVRQRFARPRFGVNDDFAITVDLDYRLFRLGDYKARVEQVDRHHRWLVDQSNKHYRFFLELSPAVPRAARIKIPLAINPALFRRLVDQDKPLPSTKSCSLGSRHDRVELRAVVTQPALDISLQAQYDQLKQADHILARDFGYTDTVSLSVLKNDFDLSLEAFRQRLDLGKAEVKSLYQTHRHQPDIVKQVQFSGRRFIERLTAIGQKIDCYKSEVDLTYNKIERLIGTIRHHLGHETSERLDPDTQAADPFVNRLIGKFWRMKNAVTVLKKRIREQYKKAKGLKKSWFGFLTNVEKKLTVDYRAAVVVEDLTVVAAEKETPGYKGRAFNRLVNNGSKGLYMRLARDKQRWNGVLETRIPAFYSSKSCVIHGLVEEKKHAFRQGKVFHCPVCNVREDADLHASETIGSYLLLRPAPGLAPS